MASSSRARSSALTDEPTRREYNILVGSKDAAAAFRVHLARLREQKLIDALAQGKHRYFRLAGPEVAAALESLQLANKTTMFDAVAGTIVARK